VSIALHPGVPTGAPIYLDDFEEFVDSGQAVRDDSVAVVSEERPTVNGKWVLAGGYCGARNGRLLFAGRGQNAPTLTFRPGLKGRYAIHVCAFGKRAFHWPFGAKTYDGFGVFIKLDSDPHFTVLMTERSDPSFEDLYFKTADLNEDSRIEIGNFTLCSYLTAIKLVPVARPGLPKRKGALVGILDFADDVPFAQPRHLAAACAVRRHAEMGFDLIMWEAGNGTICEYPTKVGKPRDDDNPVVALLREYDVMRQAVDEAKRVGIPIYGWSRLLRDPNRQEGVAPPTPFHAAHPEMVQTDKDGRPSWKLSFAFPEARRYMIDMLCEIAAYGMDGIFVDILRHPPVVRYDLPLVDAFQEQTGVDPRDMPGDGTEEWLRFRCATFTQFLHDLRTALDAQNDGRRYPIIVRTVDRPWRNLQIGCDVDRWLAEGVLDGLILAPHCPSGDNYPEHLDLRPYVAQAKGRTSIYGQVWRCSSGVQAEAMAADLSAQGVHGVVFYESNLAVARPSLRQRMWRFGHPSLCRALPVD